MIDNDYACVSSNYQIKGVIIRLVNNCDRLISDRQELIDMEHYMIQQHVLIAKHYYQNGESLIATIRKVRLLFGRNNVPNHPL